MDDQIEPLFNLDEYEAEMTAIYDYLDKITLLKFHSERKRRDNKIYILLL